MRRRARSWKASENLLQREYFSYSPRLFCVTGFIVTLCRCWDTCAWSSSFDAWTYILRDYIVSTSFYNELDLYKLDVLDRMEKAKRGFGMKIPQPVAWVLVRPPARYKLPWLCLLLKLWIGKIEIEIRRKRLKLCIVLLLLFFHVWLIEFQRKSFVVVLMLFIFSYFVHVSRILIWFLQLSYSSRFISFDLFVEYTSHKFTLKKGRKSKEGLRGPSKIYRRGHKKHWEMLQKIWKHHNIFK